MRLIDADALREEILNDNTYDNDTVNYYLGTVDDTETAYDVDKVVDELKKNKVNCKNSGTIFDTWDYVKLKKAIELVKGDESEETEAKKDIEWAIKEIEGLETETSENWPHNKMIEKEIVLGILNQLDEPEVNSQINKLANFIMSEVEGEPSQSQGAVDTAIRIIKSYQNQDRNIEKWN